MKPFSSKWSARLVSGVLGGAAIAFVDNCAFEGEASPILVIALLFAATAASGAIWGRSAWMTVAVIWACVPLAHVVKHFFGLPDTLHPNTYTSILLLAAFTFAVAAVGTACGMLIRRPAMGPARLHETPQRPA
jgi:hypothetical protein